MAMQTRKKFNIKIPSEKSHGTSQSVTLPSDVSVTKPSEESPMGPESNMHEERPDIPPDYEYEDTKMDTVVVEPSTTNETPFTPQKSHGTFEIKMIHRSKIFPNEKNFYSKENIKGLAMLIKVYGLEQNLLVTETEPDRYRIVGGEKRYRATELLYAETGEYEYLPCKIVDEHVIEDEDDENMRIIASNSYRQLTDAEKFKAFIVFKQSVENKVLKGTMDPIVNKKQYYAYHLQMSETQIQRCINISNNLPLEIQNQILEGKLSIRQADELSKAEQCRQKSHGTLVKKKEISYTVNTDRLGLIPELVEDAKVHFSNEHEFKSEETAVAAEKLINQISKSLQKLNELMEKENAESIASE